MKISLSVIMATMLVLPAIAVAADDKGCQSVD